MMTSLDRKWELLKPQIINLLEEGWSRSVVFHRLGIYDKSKIYQLCFKLDFDFQNKISKFRKNKKHFIYNKSEQNI